MRTEKSEALLNRAKKVIPGGVNSPVRAYKAVDEIPRFIERGEGAYIYDVDKNRYIDYVCSWGPLILGHADPDVISAIQEASYKGTSYGAPTLAEVELAEMIVDAVPSVEKVRLVNSGTEATMSAIRLARGYTNRDIIIKFEGCYHGHGDSFLAKAGSGVATFGLPDSLGVPKDIVKNSITLPFNNLDTLKDAFLSYKDNIAAVIVEPVAGNMGVIPPKEGFLEGLRELTMNEKSVLIFDEVITGFRVNYGGAQKLYGITPDLTCLGKIIGGGLPVGAYGGKKEIMNYIAPEGGVYQAGTLSGNPLAVAAGIATLKKLKEPKTYDKLDEMGDFLTKAIFDLTKKYNIKATANRVGSMFSLFFTNEKVTDYNSAKKSDTKLFASYFKKMLSNGIYIAPSQFEASFISLAHTYSDLEKTIEAADKTFKEL